MSSLVDLFGPDGPTTLADPFADTTKLDATPTAMDIFKNSLLLTSSMVISFVFSTV
jgi:hypothetical protein